MNTRSIREEYTLRWDFAIVCLIMVSCLTPATAASADSLVPILPVQVCNDSGTTCANSDRELYIEVTNKIWAQADIEFSFLNWETWNSTAHLSILGLPITSPALFFDQAPEHSLKTSIPSSITMYFIISMEDGTYGEAEDLLGEGEDEIVIMNNVFADRRIDTIAHELGHILGLQHQPSDPGMDEDYLMWSGDRNIPLEIGDINPDGHAVDKFTNAQITRAQASPLVVPVPGTFLLMMSGLGILMCRVRRRQSHA